MNTIRERRKKQAKAYLERGYNRDETLLYLVEKNCTAATAEGILDELTPNSSLDKRCKKLFIGGMLASGTLINLIIYSVSGYLHYGALLMTVLLPLAVAIRYCGPKLATAKLKKFTPFEVKPPTLNSEEFSFTPKV
ncbi:MAG: hypothetical protein AAF694_22235 [Bacteroidota bacterium]